MTSSATMALHKSSMVSSPESPVSNGGESFAAKVGARKNAFDLNHVRTYFRNMKYQLYPNTSRPS